MSSERYPLSTSFWPRSHKIIILDVQQQPIAAIPIDFLSSSGVQSWTFVLKVIADCVEESGTLHDEAGQPIEPAVLSGPESVTGGTYHFRRKGTSGPNLTSLRLCLTLASCADDPDLPCTYRRGPEMKHRARPPRAGGSDSTMSNSRRSSNNQVMDCLLTFQSPPPISGNSVLSCRTNFGNT